MSGGGTTPAPGTVGSQVQVSGPLDETGLTANTVDGDIARKWYANVNNLDDDRPTRCSRCAPPTTCRPDRPRPFPAPALVPAVVVGPTRPSRSLVPS